MPTRTSKKSKRSRQKRLALAPGHGPVIDERDSRGDDQESIISPEARPTTTSKRSKRSREKELALATGTGPVIEETDQDADATISKVVNEHSSATTRSHSDSDDENDVLYIRPDLRDEEIATEENASDFDGAVFDDRSTGVGEMNDLVVGAIRVFNSAASVESGTTENVHGFGDDYIQRGYEVIDDDFLPVANEVKDEDTNSMLPEAIEFDPAAKPPLYRNRRIQFYTFAFSVVLLAVLVGITVWIVEKNMSTSTQPSVGSEAPTGAPTTHAENEYWRQFEEIMGSDVSIPGTASYMAADWIVSEDPMKLPSDANNLIQRFILANFYFATSKSNKGWRSCGFSPEQNEASSDCMFQDLVLLHHNDTLVYSPVPATRWLSNSHECEWVGISCDNYDDTFAMEIWGQNLTGTIPSFLTELSLLQSISLAHNDFTGQLPSEFASIRFLKNLELHGNHLTGPIPEEYWDVTGLQALVIGDNKLNGTLSPNIGKLTDLKGLHIFENQFSGSFPVNVTTLEYLAFMRVSENRFTGTIHTEFGNLSTLQELWYQKNEFHGTIPVELGNMSSLTDLRMDNNNLRGTIPESIYTLTDLVMLKIYGMRGIVGTISTSIGKLKAINWLKLEKTSMGGTIPTELGLCTNLMGLWVNHNRYLGPMPSAVCELTKLRFLQADCLGSPPPFECDLNCCTKCCDRGGSLDTCIEMNITDKTVK